MRVFFITLSLLLCNVVLCAGAGTSSTIELRLDAETYYPGDMIELRAEMRRPDYAAFTIRMPSHPKLHFVAHTPQPVGYEDGEYVQQAVWHFQPVTAGEFVLTPIEVHVKKQSGIEEMFTLPPVSVVVQSYGEVDLSDELAILPADQSVRARDGYSVAVLLLLAVVVGVFVFWIRRKASSPIVEAEGSGGSLAELTAKLEQGEPAIEWIELHLTREGAELSAELREAMEAAVYGGRQDVEHLLQLLKSGGAS